MAIFEYSCSKCGYKFDKIVRRSEDEPKVCPKCRQAKVEKQISVPSQFQWGRP